MGLKDELKQAQANGGAIQQDGQTFTIEDIEHGIADIEESLRQAEESTADPLAEMQENARAQTHGTADAVQAALDKYKQTADENAEESKSNLGVHATGGTDQAADELGALLGDFKKLRQKAADEADAAHGAQQAEIGGVSKEMFGTFSAAALQAAGGGNSPMERTAKAAEALLPVAQKQAAAADQLAKIDADLLQEVRMSGVFTA